MVKGLNRINILESSIKARKHRNYSCVFLSHQKRDREFTKQIADFLLNNGIDVYFDEYDENLKFSYQNDHPNKVTEAILKGINCSSHMLVVVSPNTVSSSWVPFEIGFGYNKTDLAVLTLKGISKEKLPEYLKIAKQVRDIYDINGFVNKTSGENEEVLMLNEAYCRYNSDRHPLRSVMDKIIT